MQVPGQVQRAALQAALAQSAERLMLSCPKCRAVYLKTRKPAFDAHVEKCKEKPAV